MPIKIAVLRGGSSPHDQHSLAIGDHLRRAIPGKFETIDIYVDQSGQWFSAGLPTDPSHLPKMADLAISAVRHAREKAGIQGIFEKHKIPFIGSPSISESFARHKSASKDAWKAAGIKSPYYKILHKKDFTPSTPRDLFLSFPIPAIVKPVVKTYGEHVYKVETLKQLIEAFDALFALYEELIIEEFLKSKNVSVAVARDFRGKDLYSFIPLETERGDAGKSVKYPGNLKREEILELERRAREAHEALGLGHFSVSDFLVHPRRGVYIIDTDTEPDLRDESVLGTSLRIIGSSPGQFLEHLVGLSL